MHVTIGDLIARGRCVEIGCHACHFHAYVDAGAIPVAAAIPISTLSELLTCPQCWAVNAEPGYPLWARPDAWSSKMGRLPIPPDLE